MPKRTPVENAEGRLRRWVQGDTDRRDSDVAADIRTLLTELDVVRARLADLDEVEVRAKAVVRAYEGDKIYSIETGPGSMFMDRLGDLCDLLGEPDCRTIGPF